MGLYREYERIDFPAFEQEILAYWKEKGIFQQSIDNRSGAATFTFYEGPPSANGMPGIHHVLSRTLKDIFCRYKTLQGFRVDRKGGWDTHGLPIELQVEKSLGITKDDIGTKISIEDYNKACKQDVLKFKDVWNELTERSGYWVDLENPYITYENTYIESLWAILRRLYDKGLLYKGYTIQPYSPAAGTGLSSHELNQPGTYKDVKDTTVIAQFSVKKDEKSAFLFEQTDTNVYFLAWTTTPWTLPSNAALAVGKNINYVLARTFNHYTNLPITVILAKDLFYKYFPSEDAELKLEDYQAGQKHLPYRILAELKGKDLEGMRYEQLMPYVQPTDGDAFRVITGDFVTTEDGTGIVHIAPSFGADDFRVAKQNGIGSLTLVDKQGKFTAEVTDYAGEFVKEAYLNDDQKETERKKQEHTLKGVVSKVDKYLSVDERITLRLKMENKAFKIEKYEHTYPHCWRTDKPILYYPLESWFVKTTAVKDRLVELNKTINWKPESTGTGRFGNWLENLVDWNLSRSRFWGTPLPIWRTRDTTEEVCIGSIEELKGLLETALQSTLLSATEKEKNQQYLDALNAGNFDLHRPFVDEVVLVSAGGKTMYREADLIDVWFDSGAMPYAQWHWPFDNEENFRNSFPADFIAEGVDQTRGWFFTLHALSVMLFDSVAYKNVVANGLVLDKNGNKMSKRLGNAVDPFSTIDKYGADAVRWYMLSNAAPWDNLKFDLEGVGETQRKLFSTLYNIYSFFALYANIDRFDYSQPDILHAERPEIDRWILSLLNTLVQQVETSMNDYDPTRATRAIQDFVTEHLSNWYVRLCRRRFWKGELNEDKISAYQTLYTCLETVAKLMSSFAPFYADKLFRDLNDVSHKTPQISVHLCDFPVATTAWIDAGLEERMQMAQDISSLVLSIRKKVNIRVRQPLQKILVPIADKNFADQLELVKALVLSEVNVKELEYLTEDKLALKRKIKANFKTLGKKAGKLMKLLAETVVNLGEQQLREFEANGQVTVEIEGTPVLLETGDLEITFDDVPGWQVATNGKLLVALDIHISEDLKQEGLARELVNRIQNLRKDLEFEVTDKIDVKIIADEPFTTAFLTYKDYICAEILAKDLQVAGIADGATTHQIEIDEHQLHVSIKKSA